MNYDLSEERCQPYTHATTRVRQKLTNSHIYVFVEGRELLKLKLRYTYSLYWNNDIAYENDANGRFTFQVLEPGVNYLMYFPLNPGEKRLNVYLEYFTGSLPATILWAPDCVVDRNVSYVEILPYDAVDIR